MSTILNAKPCLGDDPFSFVHMGTEIFSFLVFSHLFNLILKPFGQGGPVSQVLAGMVLGPIGLSHIKLFKQSIFGDSPQIYNQTLATFIRIIYMFLFGLEMDFSYFLRSFKFASWVAYSSVVSCIVLAAAFSPLLYHQADSSGNGFSFFICMMMLLASTSSPTVIKMTAELKIDSSEVGRLAILSALINELSVLFGIAVTSTWGRGVLNFWGVIKGISISLTFALVAIALNQRVAKYYNRRNPHRKHLKNIEVFSIMLVVTFVSVYAEMWGYNSSITCFFLGLMFPREGKTYRTLVHKMAYPVDNFLLPLFFANMGFQLNLRGADRGSIGIIILIIFLSISAKFGGAFVCCRYLNINPKDSIFLALLMNVKGHAGLLIVSLASVKYKWTEKVYNMYLVTVVFNTVIVGPFLALIVRREDKSMAFRHVGLEMQKPDSEVRTLACVHGPRHVRTMVTIIAASLGSRKFPFATFVMHLVELTDKSSSDLLYNQHEDIADDEDYGGNDELEINENIDSFVTDTRVPIHQVKLISHITTMHSDLCNSAKNLRVSIIILPFHKHQRVDGKMQTSKEGIRTTNQKVLRAAPCSVGILVDRGFAPKQVSDSEMKQQVAALFFGGPDDREALAYSSQMAMHPDVKLTVFRFLPVTSKELQASINMASNEEDEILMDIMTHVTEKDADEAFLANFCNRYVTLRHANYVEKFVENGTETMAVLSEMKDMYSLFVVGKGGRGLSPLTTGMSDWEECPELGVVGDVLASSDMVMSASVLVIQQHRALKNEYIDHHAP